jgi:hypothetical protein
MAQLPEIKLTCRNGHTFASRARGSSSVSCPECRKDGDRVSVWVPKNRPRTITRSRAASGDGGQADAELAAMMARWAREPAWDGTLRFRPGRPGRDECAECGELVQWEPGRTLIYCASCKRGGLPPAVTEHYARQAQRSTQVATRGAAVVNPAAERAVRVRVRAMAQRMTDRIGEWIDAFDPDGLSGTAERLALDYQAELAAYLPEIKAAKTEDELATIMAEIGQVTERARQSGAVDAIERQRDAIERQAEQAEREALLAEEQARRQAERERAELERARREQLTARPGPKAIGSGARLPMPSQTSGYAAGVAGVISVMEQARREKAKRLEKYGACDFPHRRPVPAERLYGIQAVDGWHNTGTGYQVPGTPQYRACRKHFTNADAAINSTGFRAPAVCYWELRA